MINFQKYKSFALFLVLSVIILFTLHKFATTPNLVSDEIKYKNEVLIILDRLNKIKFDNEYINSIEVNKFKTLSVNIERRQYPGRANPFSLNSTNNFTRSEFSDSTPSQTLNSTTLEKSPLPESNVLNINSVESQLEDLLLEE